jgi:hypothetical protein
MKSLRIEWNREIEDVAVRECQVACVWACYEIDTALTAGLLEAGHIAVGLSSDM